MQYLCYGLRHLRRDDPDIRLYPEYRLDEYLVQFEHEATAAAGEDVPMSLHRHTLKPRPLGTSRAGSRSARSRARRVCWRADIAWDMKLVVGRKGGNG